MRKKAASQLVMVMQVKFIAKISSMGQDRFIINIPKDFHADIKNLRKKARQVKVTIEEAI